MPLDIGPDAPPAARQVNGWIRGILGSMVLGLFAIIWTLVAGLAGLEAEIAASKRMLSKDITRLEGQMKSSMQDRYRSADARRDFALRDQRLDHHEGRIEKAEVALDVEQNRHR